MIARIWRGRADPAKAADYQRHFNSAVAPYLRGIPGHVGSYLLRRDVDGEVEFQAVTLWTSMEAVRQFAGDRPDRAVVEPEAQAALTWFDDFVAHFEVAYDGVTKR